MIKKGITALSFACLCNILLSCQSENHSRPQELVLTNRSAVELTDKAVVVSRGKLSDIPEGNVFPVLLTEAGDTVAAQLDDLDGDKQWDELFFVTNLIANGTQTLKLSWAATQPNYTRRTQRPVWETHL